jgi:HSP20 family protein
MTAPETTNKSEPTTATVPAKVEDRRLRFPDPFDFFEDMRGEMARLWGQRPLIPRSTFRMGEGIWAPRMDVFEKNGNVHIKVELPGVNKDAVKVEMDNGDLIIQAERKAEEEVREEDYYRMERTYGSFYRRVAIPFEVKAEQIKASYTDGVLEVEVPKPAKAVPAPMKIAVH